MKLIHRVKLNMFCLMLIIFASLVLGYYLKQNLSKRFIQPVADYITLINALKAKDYTVIEKEVSQDEKKGDSFISVPPKFIEINRRDAILVYEFNSEAIAEKEAKTILKPRSPVSGIYVSWLRAKHYRRGRIIVLYAGKNDSLIKNLNELLGKPLSK